MQKVISVEINTYLCTLSNNRKSPAHEMINQK